MKFSAVLSILILCLGLGACCTKKDCDEVFNPYIPIQVQNFTDTEILSIRVYIQDKNTSVVLDSLVLPYNYFSIDERMFELTLLNNKGFELKDFSYRIGIGNTLTSPIHDIQYEKYSRNVDCNSCFPFGNQGAVVKDFKDFRFSYNGKNYGRNDTLLINK